MSVIPYDLVATKMNFWYTALKNNWSGKAEDTRKEVERELEQMEENQDVLVYYNLLLFRHNLQLDYMYSTPGVNLISRFDEFKKIRDHNNLEGMLEYYYHFFAGMYHFRQKELILALNFYRDAEKKLDSFDCDELEKAEFYFKASEVYYHMKQTFFSMNYASHAYNIYKKYETYGERRVQSQFIIAGNWLDHMYPEKALHNLNKALKESETQEILHLMGSSHLNIGICYNKLEDVDKATYHFQRALKFYKEEKHSFLPKTLFNLAHVRAKQGKFSITDDLYFEGKELAERNKNLDMLAKFDFIKGLYLSFDLDMVRESFKFFESKGKYADMEEYGLIAAELLEKKEKIRDAVEFYRITVKARRQIQRSAFLHVN
ncbi:tetratricopeptide repeat protein [Bacillus haynesii]|uniref:response regulator aspartate phosphatase n=1 Tax=Bacillus haynesii TaxID=1925021 RepID=UPI00227ED8DD|nr:tetratricopeptide repeat protein [Bacillus haynesii]MCY8713141.1 tetratricopeptide repeat protein [Bacillus haynesii]MCY8738462.1 tetratricopeptide repeat protein [Bacillus haynesii]MCY9147330.1 tetratricopeptide repeat protein [Bacillus haynesii]MCY9317212.1 tetratricopeptide repeat protein [Bacillus haynesii]MCY9331021.1 tetratricopeptide repeat protein [Bacillus haynesii]